MTWSLQVFQWEKSLVEGGSINVEDSVLHVVLKHGSGDLWGQGRPPQADELESAALYIAVPFLFLNKENWPMIELSGLHYILEELKS